MNDQPNNQGTPRRRKRTRSEIIKENYLPTIIIGVSVILCAIFIITALVRADAARKAHEKEVAASIAAAEELKRQHDALAQTLLTQAEEYAAGYDYQKAIDTIDTFPGDITAYTSLLDKRAEYEQAKSQLVLWNDPAQIPNLSFQVLIADSSRAYRDRTYSSAYNKNFVTIDEFPRILQQLYDNGYILVSLDDVYSTGVNESGSATYAPKDLFLPAGKKPLMLTQTQVNYYTYMTDGNGDKLPDAKGAGFATKLIVDENGKLANTYIDAQGNTLTGAYDMIPLLEAFLEVHPDFSYRGARAVIAVTGYDGLFGYRTNPGAATTFGDAQYQKDIADAKKVAEALREAGYEIACYTYSNIGYGTNSISYVKSDLAKWESEVVPILGDVRTFVFAQNSDISTPSSTYSGQHYQALREQGFAIFLGFCGSDGKSWAYEGEQYVRMGRLMVSGSNMYHRPNWFNDLFDAKTVLDSNRGNVPA